MSTQMTLCARWSSTGSGHQGNSSTSTYSFCTADARLSRHPPPRARVTGPLVSHPAVHEVMLDDDVVPTPGLASGHAAAHTQPGLVVLGYMPVDPHLTRGITRFPARQ